MHHTQLALSPVYHWMIRGILLRHGSFTLYLSCKRRLHVARRPLRIMQILISIATMPSIEHAALWTTDLERARTFYERWFDATAGARYENEEKAFTSYFLQFDSGARLELMHTPDVAEVLAASDVTPQGYAHLAFSVGSEQAVDNLTEQMKRDGIDVVDGPRRTGDGYYESVVRDIDGNLVEITI